LTLDPTLLPTTVTIDFPTSCQSYPTPPPALPSIGSAATYDTIGVSEVTKALFFKYIKYDIPFTGLFAPLGTVSYDDTPEC
ncbi:MAG: hypothetical protein KKH51_11145, partial [Actinobacteria bacterium]|nr:hypothetical protein [Actinomycetota bacterium]